MDKNTKFVYIPDQDGNDVKFEVIAYFEIEKLKGKYIVAFPTNEDTSDAYAFKLYDDEDGSTIFVALEEDDDEFKMVSEAYELTMEEQ
ncbi:DUF1292 domain-containing protein [Clostridium sp. BJN0001]|uniref:DUF1292 domain-containing protein n=1 Tax=Clostridium sp. BJN0001 TaxID=2930219 RepID=UPI001FCF9225|nr:DUF1292 domain-containing protein [Clostridium sp. BJN0001]